MEGTLSCGRWEYILGQVKGIDGGLHEPWSMRFNSIQREEPYPPLTSKTIRGSVTLKAKLLEFNSCPGDEKKNERVKQPRPSSL